MQDYEKYASTTGLVGPTGPTSLVGLAGPMSFVGLLSQMSVDAGWLASSSWLSELGAIKVKDLEDELSQLKVDFTGLCQVLVCLEEFCWS